LRATNITKTALAKRVGVDRTYISHIIAGRHRPSLEVAGRLAKEANVPIESFLEDYRAK
jgi:transcriptional regulator with XRE-family HTH domain